MGPPPTNPELELSRSRRGDELVILMIRTTKAMVDRLRAQRPDPRSAPLTVVHGLAAHYLVDRNDVTAGQLARYLKSTKQSTSEVVAVLEEAGLVKRAPHPTDGRARVLLLTPKGLTRLEDGRRRWQEIEDQWESTHRSRRSRERPPRTRVLLGSRRRLRSRRLTVFKHSRTPTIPRRVTSDSPPKPDHSSQVFGKHRHGARRRARHHRHLPPRRPGTPGVPAANRGVADVGVGGGTRTLTPRGGAAGEFFIAA